MHATNDNALAGGHHGCKRIRPSRHRNSAPDGLIECRIAGFDRGRIQDDLRIADAFGGVRRVKSEAFFLEAINFDGIDFV